MFRLLPLCGAMLIEILLFNSRNNLFSSHRQGLRFLAFTIVFFWRLPDHYIMSYASNRLQKRHHSIRKQDLFSRVTVCRTVFVIYNAVCMVQMFCVVYSFRKRCFIKFVKNQVVIGTSVLSVQCIPRVQTQSLSG